MLPAQRLSSQAKNTNSISNLVPIDPRLKDKYNKAVRDNK